MSKELPLAKGEAKGLATQRDEALLEDAEALVEFCADLDFEDISLKKWKNANRSLDLIIPVFISSAQAQEGGQKDIVFSRIVKESPTSTVKKKEKIKFLLQWLPKVQNSFEVKVPGLGDVSGRRKGLVTFVIEISEKA